MRRLALAVPVSLLLACVAAPPANWARGGALLDLPRARWVLGDLAVDVMPDGKIFVNGEHELNVDRGGRVHGLSAEPVALLEVDGRVTGPNDDALGQIGVLHAALPGEANAWLTVARTGAVIRYGEDGEREPFGVWSGCAVTPRAHQTCTLITHLLGLRIRKIERQRAGAPVHLGPGLVPFP
ncbi:hypothetical protein SOCEGT47_076620 [Sorangium cellulosum]|uniref:Secreted protein n=1 Tax=Sorangium cellulosum TaxID=56 RepID=A0A4P2QD65_SORCE|nr:hypothetical protein [Sorangium cellulosum]AUX27083.1 hypothetical protein SOCEGT47_076620 [Sorangium cellulosum]